MARPSLTSERQAELADALRRLLPRKGYAGASIKDIAAEAGVAAGLVHHHFRSKSDILVRVVEDLSDALEARIPAGPLAPRQAVHALISAWLGTGPGASAEAVLCWAAIGAEAALRPEVQVVYAQAVAAQVDRLSVALARAAPDRSPAELRATAAMVHAVVEGSFRMHASAPGVIPPGSAQDALLSIIDAWLDSPR